MLHRSQLLPELDGGRCGRNGGAGPSKAKTVRTRFLGSLADPGLRGVKPVIAADQRELSVAARRTPDATIFQFQLRHRERVEKASCSAGNERAGRPPTRLLCRGLLNHALAVSDRLISCFRCGDAREDEASPPRDPRRRASKCCRRAQISCIPSLRRIRRERHPAAHAPEMDGARAVQTAAAELGTFDDGHGIGEPMASARRERVPPIETTDFMARSAALPQLPSAPLTERAEAAPAPCCAPEGSAGGRRRSR